MVVPTNALVRIRRLSRILTGGAACAGVRSTAGLEADMAGPLQAVGTRGGISATAPYLPARTPRRAESSPGAPRYSERVAVQQTRVFALELVIHRCEV